MKKGSVAQYGLLRQKYIPNTPMADTICLARRGFEPYVLSVQLSQICLSYTNHNLVQHKYGGPSGI